MSGHPQPKTRADNPARRCGADASAKAAPDDASAATPAPVYLRDVHLDVLQALAEAHPRLLRVVDVAARVGACVESIGSALAYLASAGLVVRPCGRNGGAAASPAGLSMLDALRPGCRRRTDEEPMNAKAG